MIVSSTSGSSGIDSLLICVLTDRPTPAARRLRRRVQRRAVRPGDAAQPIVGRFAAVDRDADALQACLRRRRGRARASARGRPSSSCTACRPHEWRARSPASHLADRPRRRSPSPRARRARPSDGPDPGTPRSRARRASGGPRATRSAGRRGRTSASPPRPRRSGGTCDRPRARPARAAGGGDRARRAARAATGGLARPGSSSPEAKAVIVPRQTPVVRTSMRSEGGETPSEPGQDCRDRQVGKRRGIGVPEGHQFGRDMSMIPFRQPGN